MDMQRVWHLMLGVSLRCWDSHCWAKTRDRFWLSCTPSNRPTQKVPSWSMEVAYSPSAQGRSEERKLAQRTLRGALTTCLTEKKEKLTNIYHLSTYETFLKCLTGTTLAYAYQSPHLQQDWSELKTRCPWASIFCLTFCQIKPTYMQHYRYQRSWDELS